MRYDVFICHAWEDKEKYIDKFVFDLKTKELKPFVDRENILKGENVQKKIEEALKESIVVIIVLTENCLNKQWPFFEIGQVISSLPIIPVFFSKKTIDITAKKMNLLLQYDYVLLDRSNYEKGIQEIKKSISKQKYDMFLKHPEKKLRYTSFKLENNENVSINRINRLLKSYLFEVGNNVHTAIPIAQKIAEHIAHKILKNDTIPNSKLLDELNENLEQNEIEYFEHILKNIGKELKLLPNDYLKREAIATPLCKLLDLYFAQDTLETVPHGSLKYDDFVAMYEIDKLVLREDLIASAEVAHNWYKHNNYTTVAVRTRLNKKIVGYFTLLPITDELVAEIKSGNFKDNDLTIKHIRQYDEFDNIYKVYLACIAIHPEYQGTRAVFMLCETVAQMMLKLAEKNMVYVEEIIAEASTPRGEKYCKQVGMTKILDTNLNTKIYSMNIKPNFDEFRGIMLIRKKCKELINYYRAKYGELVGRIET
ncbi:MAG: toll/interleukin-1 receptor domain-containing protein [Bacteroidales bacterium]|jgi:predicted DNA-binding protein|nr:toll/interleukin-1 receptor domain-containing protein [Bacteroidales bacterium]